MENQNLFFEINNAKRDLQIAMRNFDMALDPKSVDICIYEIQTAQTKYERLLAEMRSNAKEQVSQSV